MSEEEVKAKFLNHWAGLPFERKMILLDLAAELEKANASKAKKEETAAKTVVK